MGRFAVKAGRGGFIRSACWLLLLSPALAFSIVPLIALFGDAAAESVRGRHALAGIAWDTLTTTTVMCGGAAIGATAVGIFAGSLLGHAEWRGRSMVRLLLILPLLVPPYLHAIAWTNLLRANGPVARAFNTAGLPEEQLTNFIYSLGGAVFIYTLAYFPLAMIMTERALYAIPRSLVEAATVYGATRLQVWRHAIWPHIRPAAATSGLVIVLLTNSELGVPTILSVRAFNFEVLTQLSAFNDVRSATLLCGPLIVIGAVLVLGEFRLGGGSTWERPELDYQKAPRQTFGKSVPRFLLLLLCATAGAVVPLTSLVVESWDGAAIAKMTALAVRPAFVTYGYVLTATLVSLAFSFFLAALFQQGEEYKRRVTDVLLMAAFAVPGGILALALLRLYGQGPVARFGAPALLLIAALAARFQIVTFRGFTQSLAQIPGELIEAAKIDGASSTQIVRSVLFPLIRLPALLLAAILVILGFSDLGSAILLYPPGGETLPVVLYAIEANAPRAEVSSLALVTLAALLIPLALVGTMIARLIRGDGR